MNPIQTPPIHSGWEALGLFLVLAFQAWQLYMQRQMLAQQSENHLAMNSRLSELLATTKGESHALGMAQGIAQERQVAKGILASVDQDKIDAQADPPRTMPRPSPIDLRLPGVTKIEEPKK